MHAWGTVNRMHRISQLDGLRALAVGLVLVDHSVAWFAGGGVGVNIFFVLSGFLITSLLLTEREKTGGVRLGMFYMRRVLRLYPALAAMLLFTLSHFHRDDTGHDRCGYPSVDIGRGSR